jgi:creatinine amidohydrolase
MENFPWTRLAGVDYPAHQKPMLDSSRLRAMSPSAVREFIGDGNFGGRYRQSDQAMLGIWRTAVEETRALIDGGW